VTTHASHLDLLSGQQDLAENLNRVSQNILGAQGESETQLAMRMESVLLEQQRATTALLKAGVKDANAPMVAQLHLLVSFYIRIKPFIFRDLIILQSQQLNEAVNNVRGHRKDATAEKQRNGIYLRAEIEFSFRSEVIAIHVRCLPFE
jgi:hypothetical protein